MKTTSFISKNLKQLDTPWYPNDVIYHRLKTKFKSHLYITDAIL